MSGHTKGYIGSHCITYDENNYLVLPIPLPIECETVAENGGPMLGVTIRIETSHISELAIKMEVRTKHEADRCRSLHPRHSSRRADVRCAFWYVCVLLWMRPCLVQGLCVKSHTALCADRRAARSGPGSRDVPRYHRFMLFFTGCFPDIRGRGT
jgi:hypothetical protein